MGWIKGVRDTHPVVVNDLDNYSDFASGRTGLEEDN